MMSEVDRLARLVHKLQDDLRAVSRESRLSHASIEDAGIDEYDIDGRNVSRIGKQYDNTHTQVSLAGPKPPVPSDATALVNKNILSVRWDGTWNNDQFTVAPMDFARVEIHVSSTPDFLGVLFSTLKGTVETARGGEVQIFDLLAETDYWVKLTARSQSGNFSTSEYSVGPFRVERQLSVVTPEGETVANLDDAGQAIFQRLVSNQWPEISAVDHTGKGGSLLDILDRRARGIVGWGSRYSDSQLTNNTGGVGVYEISTDLEVGRMYKICTSPLRMASNVANDLVEVQIRYTKTTDGSVPAQPNIYSQILTRVQTTIDNPSAEGVAIQKIMSLGPFGGPNTGRIDKYRFLLTFSRPSGSGNVIISSTAGTGDFMDMWVEDIGRDLGNLQVANDGGGGISEPPVQRYNKTWYASWTGSYKQDGNRRTDTGAAYQGYGDSFNGTQYALIGFPDMTGDLAGSTIEGIGLFLYAEHWWNNAGGTAIIGRHAATSMPSTYGAASKVENMVQSAGWGRGAGRWVDILPYAKQDWTNGNTRGIVLGVAGAGQNREYYGRFSGAGATGGQAPALNITYTK